MLFKKNQSEHNLDRSRRIPKIQKHLEFSVIFLLSFGGIQHILFPGPTVSVVIQFLFAIIIGILFFLNYPYLSSISFPYKRVLIAFLLYGGLVFIHSIFVAQTYPQWRYLFTVFTPTLLLPCFCLLGTQPQSFQKILGLLIRMTAAISIVFLAAGAGGEIDANLKLAYTNFVSFIYLFIIFIPYLKMRWKIVVVLLSLISLGYNVDNRSNFINIIFAYSMLILFYAYTIFRKLTIFGIRIGRVGLFALPIIFLAAGFLGYFNIFKYIETEGVERKIVLSSESGRILTTDSRTSIYEDALNNLNEKNDWIFGSSATVMYVTNLADVLEGYDDGRLGGSESGFIGLLTFGGIAYVTLFFLLCYLSSYLAIYKSNNFLLKLIGLAIAFRWFYSFVENPLTLNFNWVTIFLSIGMALSPRIREMTDKQISNYIYRI